MKNAIMEKQLSLCEEDDMFKFTFITDTHEYFYHNLVASYCANITSNCLIHGGDMISTPHEDVIDTYKDLNRTVTSLLESKVPVLISRGNHEIDKNGNYTLRTYFNQVQKPFMSSTKIINQHDERGSYYYVDYEKYKIRVVVLNTIYSGSGNHSIGNAQANWLVNKALDLTSKDIDEGNWNVMVVGHIPLLEGVDSSDSVLYPARFLDKTFGAVKSKTHLNDDNFPNAQKDFSNIKYSFIGYFCGHAHKDDVREGKNGYKHICTTGSHPISDEDGYTREYDNVNEYAFDIVSIDTTNKKISMKRIGVGSDREILY